MSNIIRFDGISYDLDRSEDLRRALHLFQDRYDEISPEIAHQILRANQAARIARGEQPWAPPPREPLPSLASYAMQTLREALPSQRTVAITLLALAALGVFVLGVIRAVTPLTLAVGFVSIALLSGGAYLWNPREP